VERAKEVAWWYWAVTVVLLFGALAGCPLEFAPVIALGGVQLLHFWWREGSLSAFPVQVRTGYLLLLLAGQWPPAVLRLWIQLTGTTAMVLADYCPLARFLSLMPWNLREPITAELVVRTFLSPPVKGNMLQGLPAGSEVCRCSLQ